MLAGERIECAIGAGASFAETCTLERAENNVLIVRHEDGGFRKLTVNAAGTIDTADGADGIQLMLLPDGRSDIVIGTDRYRLPAAL